MPVTVLDQTTVASPAKALNQASASKPGLSPSPGLAKSKRRRPRPRWIATVLGLLALGVVIMLAVRPSPVGVDVAAARVGPLEVTVNEDGRTRVQDRYVVSAPIAGTMTRSTLEAGDSVHQGEIVATLMPVTAPLLDPRTRAQANARVLAATEVARQARTALERARASAGFSARELERQRAMYVAGASSAQVLEQAEVADRNAGEELRSAEFGVRAADAEVAQARAAVAEFGSPRGGARVVRSPVTGSVLRLFTESEGVVLPGTPLVEIGDPRGLEIVVDVLSSDAVNIRPGARAIIEQWGGDSTLAGHVREVEPSAFTKLSSLGVEEQRVNVVIALDDPPERWRALGDGFRVEVRITVWQAPDILQVPEGAVFREGGEWATYVVDAGRARRRPVHLGRRNGESAQVLDGLRDGEQVIVYPSDNVHDGTRLELR